MLTQRRSGLTLLELLCTLALMGVLLGMAALPASRVRDQLALRAARAAIVNAAAAARVLATGHGGASLSISAADGTIAVATGDAAVADTLARLRNDYRVAVAFDDARLPAAVIHFDALGLGRFASRTIRLERGSTGGGVTFSAYGRTRVW